MLKITLILLVVGLTSVKMQLKRQEWWQNGNFYQIYPRSFKDSDGDGIGDLKGVIQKLDYLKDIGMDGVWLSPIFKSPMVDFGYDISDYEAIQAEYGTTKDVEDLISEAHKIGLKIVLDFVPNHTSDEHVWFEHSVNGVDKYRDFYIWHDGILNATTGKREPPSNWICVFRHSAWQWNDKRQQYYLHQFGIKQPDLNYRNPAVLEAMDNVLRFWLARGIDGFRIDAVNYFFEVPIDPKTGTYPDEPVIEDVSECPDPADWCHLEHIYIKDRAESIELVYHWRELLDDWKRTHNTETKVIMTEAFTSLKDLMLTYGNGVRNGSHIPFNFLMLRALNNESTALDFKLEVENWLKNMPHGTFANWVMGNHDTRRLPARFGKERTDLMNIFLQTLPGIAVTYYGEEYGQEDVYVSWEDTVDIQACTTDPITFDNVSRDPERTPFRWDSSKNAGFSIANKTWLPVGPGYELNNVDVQTHAEESHLKVFKSLTYLRKTEAAFNEGDFEAKVVNNVLIYKRQAQTGDAFIVVLNIGNTDALINLNKLYNDYNADPVIELTSIKTGLKKGTLVDASNFEAKAYKGYVLRLHREN